MDISIFLAKLLGWYLVITSLLMLLRPQAIQAFIKDYTTQPALMFFVALITLIFGLLLVLSHNHWVMAWPVIVTLLAWLTLIAGIVRLFAPDFHIKMIRKCIKKPIHLSSAALIYLLVGAYLLYRAHFI